MTEIEIIIKPKGSPNHDGQYHGKAKVNPNRPRPAHFSKRVRKASNNLEARRKACLASQQNINKDKGAGYGERAYRMPGSMKHTS